MNDISPAFQWNPYDESVGRGMIAREGTPEAIQYFSAVCDGLTDYGYWFFLSTLWVSYSGNSDMDLWKHLFLSNRPKRQASIMKPSELKRYKQLPYFVKAYRAHRDHETDWISYTLDPVIAERFAAERSVNIIKEYRVKKQDILALFLRRGEKEIIVLDKGQPLFVKNCILS